MAIADKLTQIANNVPLVYEAGYEKGKAEGGNTEQIIDEFASTVQSNGTKTDFTNAFLRSTITDETISEIFARWNSTIKTATKMFSETKNLSEGLYTDVLDFSRCDSLLNTFSQSNITKLKKIDARATISGWNGMANMFMRCTSLESIDEFYPSTSTKFSGTFAECCALKKVIFKSVISVSGLDIRNSLSLDKESIESIINNLSDTTTGLTVTFSLTAVNNAFVGGRDGTEWQTLIATKPNWTIAYVEEKI